MDNLTIHSLKELQSLMPRILQEYGNNNELTTLALANPIMALEQAGFTLTPTAKKEIENHVRFGKKGAAEYNQIINTIEKHIGESFDPDNHEKIADAVIKLAPSGIDKRSLLTKLKQRPDVKNKKVKDPLSEIKEAHPLISSLVSLRKMEAEHPSLAKQGDITAIKKMIDKSPLRKVVFRMKREA